VERNYDFNSFNLEKLRSADATVTGMVNKILYAIAALGKQSCRFRNLRIKESRDQDHLFFFLVLLVPNALILMAADCVLNS
jgi:hypothetical protein